MRPHESKRNQVRPPLPPILLSKFSWPYQCIYIYIYVSFCLQAGQGGGVESLADGPTASQVGARPNHHGPNVSSWGRMHPCRGDMHVWCPVCWCGLCLMAPAHDHHAGRVLGPRPRPAQAQVDPIYTFIYIYITHMYIQISTYMVGVADKFEMWFVHQCCSV